MAADVSSTRLYLGNLPRDGTQSYVPDFVNIREDTRPATNRSALVVACYWELSRIGSLGTVLVET